VCTCAARTTPPSTVAAPEFGAGVVPEVRPALFVPRRDHVPHRVITEVRIAAVRSLRLRPAVEVTISIVRHAVRRVHIFLKVRGGVIAETFRAVEGIRDGDRAVEEIVGVVRRVHPRVDDGGAIAGASPVVCTPLLGGLLKSYSRRAA
jgi:hypothetical protein